MFVCMGYAVKISTKAVDAVTGADKTNGLVAAEATGVSSLRKKWGGSELRSRVVRQGSGWVVEGGSPYSSYAGTPVSGQFSHPPSPYVSSALLGNGSTTPVASPHPSAPGFGLGINTPTFGPSPRVPPSGPPSAMATGFPTAGALGPNYGPTSPSTADSNGHYTHFPPTPNPMNGGSGFPRSPLPTSPGFTSQQSLPPRAHANGHGPGKKDD